MRVQQRTLPFTQIGQAKSDPSCLQAVTQIAARPVNGCPLPQIVVLVILIFSASCTKGIGDACALNIDCSPLGDRICDTTQLGGYCTVEGCGASSCADGASCVRFYPAQFLTVSCDPAREDAVDPAIAATNNCRPDEVCLTNGYCAQRSLERRFCMKQCEVDADCRAGYECRETGSGGAEPLRDVDTPDSGGAVRFCVQSR